MQALSKFAIFGILTGFVFTASPSALAQSSGGMSASDRATINDAHAKSYSIIGQNGGTLIPEDKVKCSDDFHAQADQNRGLPDSLLDEHEFSQGAPRGDQNHVGTIIVMSCR